MFAEEHFMLFHSCLDNYLIKIKTGENKTKVKMNRLVTTN